MPTSLEFPGLQFDEEDVNAVLTAESERKKRQLNSGAAAAPGGGQGDRASKMRDLVISEALHKIMKETRKLLGAICETSKVVKTFKVGINGVIATQGYIEATRESPQNHGKGPMHTQTVRPVLKTVMAYLRIQVKVEGDILNEVTEAETWIDGVTNMDDFNEIIRHCYCKETYDQTSILLELIWAPTAPAQKIRALFNTAITHMGGSRFFGPPPPSDEERELRKQTVEIRSDLGLPQVGKTRRGGGAKGKGKNGE